MAYGLAGLAYGSGLLLSALFDLPAGAVIVWTLGVLGVAAHAYQAWFTAGSARAAA